MKLKWTEEEWKYFNKKIPTAERNYDWIIWAIIVLCGLAGLMYLFWGI